MNEMREFYDLTGTMPIDAPLKIDTPTNAHYPSKIAARDRCPLTTWLTRVFLAGTISTVVAQSSKKQAAHARGIFLCYLANYDSFLIIKRVSTNRQE